MSEEERSKWNARYREGSHAAAEPSPSLVEIEALLPLRGRALDVAGGAGRHALWLARRGYEVTIVDISDVGLRIAEERAREEGLSISTWRADLATESVPFGPWDLILVSHYLDRALFPALVDALSPSGLLVVLHPTKRNLERHEKPGAPFLLEEGELLRLAGALSVVKWDEGWLPSGRHEARLIARKAATTAQSGG